MKKGFILALLLLVAIMPVYSQETQAGKSGDKSQEIDLDKVVAGDQLYAEETLENFETAQYSDKNIEFTQAKDQKADIAIRDQYPAPIANSKKYLGVKYFARSGDTLTINIPKEHKLVIDKYCKSISMWVYGKNFSGELSMFIMDAEGTAHRITFGKLNFLGWRKLTYKLTDVIPQEDKYLTQKRQLQIMKILYKPANPKRELMWNYFYIDDISVLVREKYTDRQSDDW